MYSQFAQRHPCGCVCVAAGPAAQNYLELFGENFLADLVLRLLTGTDTFLWRCAEKYDAIREVENITARTLLTKAQRDAMVDDIARTQYKAWSRQFCLDTVGLDDGDLALLRTVAHPGGKPTYYAVEVCLLLMPRRGVML